MNQQLKKLLDSVLKMEGKHENRPKIWRGKAVWYDYDEKSFGWYGHLKKAYKLLLKHKNKFDELYAGNMTDSGVPHQSFSYSILIVYNKVPYLIDIIGKDRHASLVVWSPKSKARKIKENAILRTDEASKKVKKEVQEKIKRFEEAKKARSSSTKEITAKYKRTAKKSDSKVEALENGIAYLKKQISDLERKIKDLSDIASPLGPKAVGIWLKPEKKFLAERKKLLKEVEAELKEERKKS